MPLLALSVACATLFFGEGVQAAPFAEGGDAHLSDADFPTPMAPGPLHWEENYTDAQCTNPLGVAPCDGEESHWIATRFEPDEYPFVVKKVSYTLIGNRPAFPGCDSTLAHKASVFRGNKTPASSPTLIQTFNVSAKSTAINDRHVELTITRSFDQVLQEGEYLYVSIQNAGNATAVPPSCNGLGAYTCAATCNASGRGKLSFWSNTNAAPFNWATLESYAINGDVRIGVYGYNP